VSALSATGVIEGAVCNGLLPFAACFRIALAAVERVSKTVLAPISCHDPGPLDPWRVVPHMSGMAARQVGHPVSLIILMKGDDGTMSLSHFFTLIHAAALANPMVIPFT
jgi:hypothetical protein